MNHADTPHARDLARGCWSGILAALGFDERALSGKHGPCPICGGKDRFRFDDKEGRGTWFCSKCRAGDGFTLLMRKRGIDFRAAAELVRGVLRTAPAVPVAREQSADERRAALERTWARAVPIEVGDCVHRYLAGRGITRVPPALRRVPRYGYYEDRRKIGAYDAMAAVVTGPDGMGQSLHVTYLSDGKKAPIRAPRKIMPPIGTITGGAVRLHRAGPTLGIAEGIETALAATAMFGIPTWAAISANGLATVVWPEDVRRLVIFADNDESFAGQEAAYALARRAHAKELAVEVRIPARAGTDWNDELLARQTCAQPALVEAIL